MSSAWVCDGAGLRPAPSHTHADVPRPHHQARHSGVNVERRSGVNIPRRLTLRAFAAIYAAGIYVQRRGILPKRLNCLAVASHCLGLYLSGYTSALPFGERLDALARSDKVVVITKTADRADQIRRAIDATGTLHYKPTHREVRITAAKIVEAFPDWFSIQASKEVRDHLRIDGPNLQPKAQLAPGMQAERMYCFRLPLVEESLFTDSMVPDPTIAPAMAAKPESVEPDGWDDCLADDERE